MLKPNEKYQRRALYNYSATFEQHIVTLLWRHYSSNASAVN